MLASRFLLARLNLTLRYLHVSTIAKPQLCPASTISLHPPSSDGDDRELFLLQCLSQRDLRRVRQILDETSQHRNAVVRWTSMLSRYARSGYLDEARVLFDLMPDRNIVTWNAMLSAYARCPGRISASCEIFHQMPHRNVVSWTSMLCALSRAGRIEEARHLFAAMPDRNVVAWNSMVVGLIRNGEIDEARQVFDVMPERDRVSCNAMISGFAEREMMEEAKRLFDQMESGVADVVSWTSMIAGYCRSGDVEEAYALFRTMTPAKNVVTWTAMIGGFAWNGYHEEALMLFLEMQRTAGVKPNGETMISLLYACSGLGFPRLGQQVHAHLIINGMDGGDHDGRLMKGLIQIYAMLGLMDWAHYLFLQNPEKSDTVCANSMINGYARIGWLDEARRQFDMTPLPDEITWTIMITAYLDAGFIREAIGLFDRMDFRDDIVWTAVISGLVQNELISDALELFSDMRRAGVHALDRTFASLLGAVGSTACLEMGEQLHGLLLKTRSESDTILNNSLVSMYAKCGNIDASHHVFSRMPSRDVVSLNSMIMGLSHHGLAHEALRLFGSASEPNSVTFLVALTACSHAGMVARGSEIYESMTRDGLMRPGTEHHACMVDLLGRAGRVAEAERLVAELPGEPGVAGWGALLGTCGVEGGDAWGVGERAARRVMEMEPLNAPAHVMLCRMYAAGERYEEEVALREEMGWKRVRKLPGVSWVVVKGRTHVFLSGDRRHPQSKEIYSLLVRINLHLPYMK